MVPMLVAIARKQPVPALLLAWIWGATFFLGLFTWILVVPGYSWLHHTILAIYLGAYFAAFVLLFASVSRYRGILPAAAAAPFIWVALEYLRSNLSFLELPWGLLAHSQYQAPVIIQAAAIGGTYGISFLMVLVNAALAILGLSGLIDCNCQAPKAQPHLT